MRKLEVTGSNHSAPVLTVRFANRPSNEFDCLLVEAAYVIEEGSRKSWGQGYEYRLDRRPAHQGGNQLHIYQRNAAWAYRYNGNRSEPHKYTLPATNTVKDIVRDVFGLSTDVKIESRVLSASSVEILLELEFK